MASSVDAGVYASLAIAWDGSVRGWGAAGDTDEGQIDIPAELARAQPGEPRQHRVDGDLPRACDRRGRPSRGMGRRGTARGDQRRADPRPPGSAEGSHYAVDVAAGYLHSIAVDTRGVVSVWGSNRHGERQVPARVADEDVVDVEARGATSMVLTADGEVIAWGDSGTGLTDLPAALDNVKVVDIDLGAEVAMALTSTGDVITWGNAGKNYPLPAAVRQYAPLTGIAAGGRHLLAMHVAPVPPPPVVPPVTQPVPVPGKSTTSLALKAPGKVVAGKRAAVKVVLSGVRSGTVVITDKGKKVASLAGSGTVKLPPGEGPAHPRGDLRRLGERPRLDVDEPVKVKVVTTRKRTKG